MNNISELVKWAIAQQQSSIMDISQDHLLKEDLGITSMKLVYIITGMCNESNISILDFTDDELLTLHSVGDLITLISTKAN